MSKKRIGENPLDSLIPEDAAEKRRSNTTERPNTSKTEKPNSGKNSEEKVKATYYMATGTEQRLEAAWMKLRRMTGRKVSKSEIVEAAIRRAVQELDDRGDESELMKRLQE